MNDEHEYCKETYHMLMFRTGEVYKNTNMNI